MEKPISLRSFFITCVAGWLLMICAGMIYAQDRGIPGSVTIPVIAAFLIEFLFYLAPGFASARAAIQQRMSAGMLAPALAASALLPYLVYTVSTHRFDWGLFGVLVAIVVAASYWFVVFRASLLADVGFVALLAAILLLKTFKKIYLPPYDHVYVDVLGHLMLIRLGASVMLLQRGFRGVGFGFIPSRKEFLVGLRYFLYFLPIGVPLGWALGIVTFHDGPARNGRHSVSSLEFFGLWRSRKNSFSAVCCCSGCRGWFRIAGFRWQLFP